MGSLGGLVASRIAREFRIGGPSFTVSCDETSGNQALAIAVEWLRRGELDTAIVGAVDLSSDIRAVRARRRLRLGPSRSAGTNEPDEAAGQDRLPFACDGAVALVLKRIEDARRDDDRIYAIIRGLGSAAGGMGNIETLGFDRCAAAASLALVQAGVPAESVGNLDASVSPLVEEDWGGGEQNPPALRPSPPPQGGGEAGAATGLMAVAKAAFGLYHEILPPAGVQERWLHDQTLLPASPFLPIAPQFWLRNRVDGPRRASVSTSSLGGNCHHIILEEPPSRESCGSERPAERAQPMGIRRLGIFAVEADDDVGLSERVRQLQELARESAGEPIESLARRWWQRHPNDPRLRRGIAIVADGIASLQRCLARAQQHPGSREDDRVTSGAGTIHVAGPGVRTPPARLALVYPGLGNSFEGMGRELSTLWPEVLRKQDSENRFLRDQLDPAVWWSGPVRPKFADHRVPILGQASVGSLVTDLLRELGVVPDAAIGYSMGESAALIALRAWVDRDELLVRLRSSSLFETDLVGPYRAARQVWGIPDGEPVDWVAGIVPRAPEDIAAAIARTGRVYLLIKNAPEETVIGGWRRAVEGVVEFLKCPFIELPTVSTVHCEISRVVEREYRALHDLETMAPAGITFYSGVLGRSYTVDRSSARDVIAAQATQPIDFPAVIERAYADGVGVFVEVGPGGSCTRLIDRILASRPHVACSACRPDVDALAAVLQVLGECVANRLPVDLGRLYGRGSGGEVESLVRSTPSENIRLPTVRIDVGGWPPRVPVPPSRARLLTYSSDSTMHQEEDHALSGLSPPDACETPLAVDTVTEPGSEPSGCPGGSGYFPPSSGLGALACALVDADRARSEAHRVFLRVRQGITDLIGRQIALQLELIEEGQKYPASQLLPHEGQFEVVERDSAVGGESARLAFDRRQCLELAVGSVAGVLGPEFAEVDRLPTRVRLPAEPLMLVDRILAIEGTPRSLQGGRVVTEHEVQPGAWYLDNDRVAPCIAMEAGQADLVLCGYLGVDFVTRGRAVYRLLDATITFHRGLPGAGAVLRYDIRITEFFRQGTTILFRFEFDGTVDGELLLTMRDGCAGFFTFQELSSGKGIIPRSVDLGSSSGPRSGPDDDLIPMPMRPRPLDERQVEALRHGDLGAAFGAPFDRLRLADPLALPGGRMTLIHRVETLDPAGGPSGLGLIRAEADIQPGEWFLACHFVDDPVMPGTLMYESCLHTLRIFMMRLGWVGRRGEVAFEPVPGIANRLKCRGQIVESTRVVAYEVAIKERGYRPEPYAVADAMIIADGKPIVAVSDLALQLTGTSRRELERLWEGCPDGE
jgi:3-hydroxymyristoyl/3-hydroxydecanoyl-(acyl carrier protein) dehydratase/malonyl CoA-acyl carrier protein transacylase